MLQHEVPRFRICISVLSVCFANWIILIMFRFLIGHLLKRDLQQVNEPFNKLFVRSFLKNYFNRYWQYYSYAHWFVLCIPVYRDLYVCHQYQAGKGCLHFANTEYFKALFLSLFFNPCTAETCFVASSLLSNCMFFFSKVARM